jgi:hypothetical protein
LGGLSAHQKSILYGAKPLQNAAFVAIREMPGCDPATGDSPWNNQNLGNKRSFTPCVRESTKKPVVVISL